MSATPDSQRLADAIYGRVMKDPVLVEAVMRFVQGWQTPGFVGSFAGRGAGLVVDEATGETTFTADNGVFRGSLTVLELLYERIRFGSDAYMFTSGGKVESVELVTVDGETRHRVRWDTEDGHAPTQDDDLMRMQRARQPRGKVEQQVVAQSWVRVASVDDKARYSDLVVEHGNPPQVGDEFARYGNATNPRRQGGVFVDAMGDGPYLMAWDGVDSRAAWVSGQKIKALFGRLNILGVYAGGPDVYGFAAGEIAAGAWIAVTGQGGVEFRYADDEVLGYVRERSIRIGSETSYFLFNADEGVARWVVSGADQGGALASISQTVYGNPDDPDDAGVIGALTEIQTFLANDDGDVSAIALLNQQVFEETDPDGNVTLRGATNELRATVYDPETGLAANQATLRQDVDVQGARQVVSVDGTGGLAEIELSTGNATGNQIRIGTEQLLIEALRTVFGPPGYLTDPTTDAAAWRVPANGPGLGTPTGTVAEDGVLTIEGAVETREAVRWTGGADAPLVVAARGTIAIGARLGIDVAWFSAAGNLVDVTTAISTDPQSQDPEPFDLTGRVEAPADAAYYRVRVDAGTAQDTVDLTSLTAQPQVEAGLLGRTIIDDNGNIQTDRIDVQAVVNAARVVAKEIEAGTGYISLLRAGLAITIDGRQGRIAVRDAQGREVLIGAFDFGDVISGEVGTAPEIDGSNGLSQVQAYTGAPAPDDDYAQTHTAAAGAGRSYTVRADLSAAVSLDGPGASGRASATVAAWYEVGGAETAGSRRTASADTLSASSQTDAHLALAAAPANATLVVRVQRNASASVTGGSGGGLGQGFESAQATASTTGLQVLVDGVSGQFIGPAGTAYVDDDGDSAYMKRAGGEVGMERLFFRGQEYHDNGDGILRRV